MTLFNVCVRFSGKWGCFIIHIIKLKNLVLFLVISFCANSSILYSIENKELNNIENEELNNIFQSIEQRKNRIIEIEQSKDYKHLMDLSWQADKLRKQYENNKKEIMDFIIESKMFISTVIGMDRELFQMWSNNLDDRNRLREMKDEYKNNKGILKMLESKLKEIDQLGRNIFWPYLRYNSLNRYVAMFKVRK